MQWLVDENGANQGKLILELRVCYVVAMLAVHFKSFQQFTK
jgi:hypothetical protein